METSSGWHKIQNIRSLQYHQPNRSKMGGGNWVENLDSVSLTPESALSAENKIDKLIQKNGYN